MQLSSMQAVKTYDWQPMTLITNPQSPYEHLLHLTHRFLGPDAVGHILGIIEMHLQKPPEELTKDDLISLIDWLSFGITFLVSNEEKAHRFLDKLTAYAQSPDGNE